jgi:hypothetical protein
VPYREPPPTRASYLCEICGQPGERERCAPCGAVLTLEGLEVPVVVVRCSWYRWQPYVGIGMVFVDRWRQIARCVCRIVIPPPLLHDDAELLARTRAALWSPMALVPSNEHEHEDALLESLRRTHYVDYGLVRDCFRDAVDLAYWLADGARETNIKGTWLEEWELGLELGVGRGGPRQN